MDYQEEFLNDFLCYIEEHRLIECDDTIVVGFSGGVDSTALLKLLIQIRYEMKLKLIAAHINYNLRGKDSIADMNFAKEFCFGYGIPIVVKDVKEHPKNDIENWARKTRFNYFEQIKKLYNADKIALGHNKNDFSETVLLHLFRGAGLTGMRGILPQTGDIIHPMLSFERDDIVRYMRGEKWREDGTNAENSFTRNRVRHFFIDKAKDLVNEKVVDTIYHNADIFIKIDSFLEESAMLLKSKSIHYDNNGDISLKLRKLRPYKEVILYYIFRSIIKDLTGVSSDFYRAHFQEIMELLGSDGSKIISLHGNVWVVKKYDKLIFTKVKPDTEKKTDSILIDISKRYNRIGDYVIRCKRVKAGTYIKGFFQNELTAAVDYEKLKPPLTAGYKQDGDKFVPLGMDGTKKLKDFFIDEKISKFERNSVIIVRDNEKIVWIAGYRMDDRVKITEKTEEVLILTLSQVSVRNKRSAERKK